MSKKTNEPMAVYKFTCKTCGTEHKFTISRSQLKQAIKKIDRDVRKGNLIKIED